MSSNLSESLLEHMWFQSWLVSLWEWRLLLSRKSCRSNAYTSASTISSCPGISVVYLGVGILRSFVSVRLTNVSQNLRSCSELMFWIDLHPEWRTDLSKAVSLTQEYRVPVSNQTNIGLMTLTCCSSMMHMLSLFHLHLQSGNVQA